MYKSASDNMKIQRNTNCLYTQKAYVIVNHHYGTMAIENFWWKK